MNKCGKKIQSHGKKCPQIKSKKTKNTIKKKYAFKNIRFKKTIPISLKSKKYILNASKVSKLLKQTGGGERSINEIMTIVNNRKDLTELLHNQHRMCTDTNFIGNVIAVGGYGQVRHVTTDDSVVLKTTIIPLPNDNKCTLTGNKYMCGNDILVEMVILSYLHKNDNILQLESYGMCNNYLYIY